MKILRHSTLALTMLSVSISATAAVVFTEDFSSSTLTENRDVIELGGATPEVVAGQWFSSTNGIAINNELQLTNFNENRSRGVGIWLDSSTWDIGAVTVAFDVLDYVVGGSDSESFFQAYFADGVNSTDSAVGFDVHAGGGVDPQLSVTGSTIAGLIGDRNTITANVTQATFTFNFTGEENIGLVFHNMSGVTGSMPVYSVDNLTVTTVPEPSSAILLALGGIGLLTHRRRS